MTDATDVLGSFLGKVAYGVERVFVRVNEEFNRAFPGTRKKERTEGIGSGLEAIEITEDAESMPSPVTGTAPSEPPAESTLEKYGPAALGVLVLAASFVALFAAGSLATGASITAAAGEILLCMIS